MTNPARQKKPRDVSREDPLADTSQLLSQEIPPGVDRRSFLIRSAVGGAAAVMTGCSVSADRENSEGRRNDAAGDGAGGDRRRRRRSLRT